MDEEETVEEEKSVFTEYSPDLQCASYALEILSHDGLRTHVLGTLITDDELELLYYDRSIQLKSEAVSFVSDPTKLVALLYAMMKLTMEGWGFDPFLEKPACNRETDLTEKHGFGKVFNTFEGIAVRVAGCPTTLVLEKEIFHQRAIFGRGTCVVTAQAKEKPNSGDSNSSPRMEGRGVPPGHGRGKGEDGLIRHPYIVKFSYIQNDQKWETDIARERNSWMLDHLPVVFTAERREAGEVQKCAGAYCSGRSDMKEPYEARELRISVQPRLYKVMEFPEDRLQAQAKLTKAVDDVFRCYKWIYEQNVLHRNISVWNLLYREDGRNVNGILNDYDMAVDAGPDSVATRRQRTGTKPFMALDLLPSIRDVIHGPEHDLESLLYCLYWVTSMEISPRVHPLYEWARISFSKLYEKKLTFIDWERKLIVCYPDFHHFHKRFNFVTCDLARSLNSRVIFEQTQRQITGFEALQRQRIAANLPLLDPPRWLATTLPDLKTFGFAEFDMTDLGLPQLFKGTQNAVFLRVLATKLGVQA